MTTQEMEDALDGIVRDTVERFDLRNWDENAITFHLVIELCKQFKNVLLTDAPVPFRLDWDVFKLKKPCEENYGDIGVLVDYHHLQGKTIQGAGFLEAKKIDLRTKKFKSVRQKQVDRLLAHSANSRLLLYDNEAQPVLDPHRVRTLLHRGAVQTAMLVLPLQLANAVKVYDRTLYRFCHSLTHQFTRRYFYLHDLDFRASSIEAIAGFGKRYITCPFLLVLHMESGGGRDREPFRPNDKVYEPLN